MQLFRNRWLSGFLLAAPLLALLPSLGLLRLAAPPAVAPVPARAITAPTIDRASPTPEIAMAVPTLSPRPTPGMLAAPDAQAISILMYHYIREVDERADPLGFRLSVRPDRFAEQMAWLRASGYKTVLMRELAACLRGEMLCPEPAVAITFDDGYADNATAALPILLRYGHRATFFVVSGFVGREGYVSREQLRALHDSGMEIGSHTVSHADMAALPLAEARAEVVRSRAALEQMLGIEVVSFSYPAGSYTPALARAVRAAGYTSAVGTSQHGTIERMYELPRRRVLGGETIEGFPWYIVPLPEPRS